MSDEGQRSKPERKLQARHRSNSNSSSRSAQEHTGACVHMWEPATKTRDCFAARERGASAHLANTASASSSSFIAAAAGGAGAGSGEAGSGSKTGVGAGEGGAAAAAADTAGLGFDGWVTSLFAKTVEVTEPPPTCRRGRAVRGEERDQFGRGRELQLGIGEEISVCLCVFVCGGVAVGCVCLCVRAQGGGGLTGWPVVLGWLTNSGMPAPPTLRKSGLYGESTGSSLIHAIICPKYTPSSACPGQCRGRTSVSSSSSSGGHLRGKHPPGACRSR